MVPRLEIDDGDFMGIHEIDVDLTGRVRREELRLSTEGGGCIEFSILGIDVGLERHQRFFAPRYYQRVAAGRVEAVTMGLIIRIRILLVTLECPRVKT